VHVNTYHRDKSTMLKAGSIVLSIWSGINFFLACLIVAIVILLKGRALSLVVIGMGLAIYILTRRIL
jgi:hypothetical protein